MNEPDEDQCCHSERLLEAKVKLDAAVNEFNKINAEEHGEPNQTVIADWVLIVAAINYNDYGTGKMAYSWQAADGQPIHRTSGLIEYAKSHMF